MGPKAGGTPELEDDEFLKDLAGVELKDEDLEEDSDDWDAVEPAAAVLSGSSTGGAPTPRPQSPADAPPPAADPTPAPPPSRPAPPQAAAKAATAPRKKPASPEAARPAAAPPAKTSPAAAAKAPGRGPPPRPAATAAVKAAAPKLAAGQAGAPLPSEAPAPAPGPKPAPKPAPAPRKAARTGAVPPTSSRSAASSEPTNESVAEEAAAAASSPPVEAEPPAPTEAAAAPAAAAEDAAAAEIPPSGGGGWGGWAALGKLGASLQAAAATAVSDVTQLSEGFQQVLMEAAAEDSQEGGEGEHAAAAPPAEDEPLPPEVEAKRREVLARLEGPDPQMASTLAAVDEQVGQLATGATKALSSLWGWGQSLAHKVEEAASAAGRELAGTLHDAQPALATVASAPAAVGSRAGLRLGEALDHLHRSAAALLEGGVSFGAGAGGEGSPSGDEAGDLFYIYGGRQACEELEALSNECARLCNRVRGRLPEDARAALDGALAALAPAFALEQEHPADKQRAGEPGATAVPEALARGHQVVEDLCTAGRERAEALAAGAQQNAGQLVLPSAVPAPVAGGEEGEAGDGAAAPDVASTAGAHALQELRSEGIKRLSEVCSVCMERLVALGRSLQATFLYGRPADDGICWPENSTAAAELLRGQARAMVADLQSLTEAFVAALMAVGRTLDSKAASKDFTAICKPLVEALETDGQSAICRVADGCKALMHVAWCSGLDSELITAKG